MAARYLEIAWSGNRSQQIINNGPVPMCINFLEIVLLMICFFANRLIKRIHRIQSIKVMNIANHALLIMPLFSPAHHPIQVTDLVFFSNVLAFVVKLFTFRDSNFYLGFPIF